MTQVTADSLLKRAALFLEDSEWDRAGEYADKVLDGDPECARAYQIKLLARMKVRSLGELAETPADFSADPDCQKILRFGSEQEKREITDCLEKCRQKALLLEREKQRQKEQTEREKQETRRKRAGQVKKAAILIAAVAAVCVVFFVWAVPAHNYQRAVSLRNEGKWEQAEELFGSLNRTDEVSETKYLHCASLIGAGDYQGVMNLVSPSLHNVVFQRLVRDFPEFRRSWFGTEGNIVTFGHWYIYTNHEPVFSDKIDWIVLRSDGSRSILISEEVLDYQPYDTSDEYDVPWSKSTLREWLNHEFYDSAFSETESSAILETRISGYSGASAQGSGTVYHDLVDGDKVYILSEREASQFFAKTDDIFAAATQYAQQLGLKTTRTGIYKARVSWWPSSFSKGPSSTAPYWLRTRYGWNGLFSQYICHARDGILNGFSSFGSNPKSQNCGVRPVICVDLNSGYFE